MSGFKWIGIKDKNHLEAFYLGILPRIREAAKALGYAVGVHGSLRRDLDLIAFPWIDDPAGVNELAAAIQEAACGLRSQSYSWEQKPNGRVATCFPICWPEWESVEPSLGHIDLSVFKTKGE